MTTVFGYRLLISETETNILYVKYKFKNSQKPKKDYTFRENRRCTSEGCPCILLFDLDKTFKKHVYNIVYINIYHILLSLSLPSLIDRQAKILEAIKRVIII